MIIDGPVRIQKKRSSGLTSILDKGAGKEYLLDCLANCSEYIDIAKLGWGTVLIEADSKRKIEIYKRSSIDVSIGGTLFELFFLQSKITEYVSYLRGMGIDIVEISDGTVEIPRADKLKCIEQFKKYFKVVSEVGSKDVEFVTPPSKWVQWINEELNAGSDYVILEGRESGTVGLYRESGEIRMGLVNEIVDSGISPDRLIFEAPKKHQQVWFIKRFGANVNLGNIPIEDVLSLETLRIGIRSDTLLHFYNKGV